jgi:A/G-specific adenine glycosylase
MKSTRLAQQNLLEWYRANRRDLPWRKNRDAYRIWISETMLQQTTTTAVIPFYEKFLCEFPTIKKLASAKIEDIYTFWAGLGYYSRARNLHKAAQIIAELGTFPETHTELLELPGFGPYTARAVSSLAFSEAVGVLDGNVIRVLSRALNQSVEWWKPKERAHLQKAVDDFVADGPSHELNQALMELGAQICTPKNPHCIQCPWMKTCQARAKGTIAALPIKKPKRSGEVWVWTPEVQIAQNKIKIIKNDYAPFLRGAWFLPGQAKLLKNRPAHYDFRHSITHHDIFVQLRVRKVTIKARAPNNEAAAWVKISELSRFVPASLVRKAVQHAFKGS